MKHRRVMFISLLLGLLLIFTALPAQAQWQGTVPDFKYDGLTADGHWKFSWQILQNGFWNDIEFRYKGGGVNVWTSVNSLSFAPTSTREVASTPPLHNAPAGNCTQDTWYNWAKISVTF